MICHQAEWATKSVFSLKQDTKMLAQNIVPLGGKFLLEICKKRNYDVADVTYFLPHLSSLFFAKKIEEELDKIGIGIPAEKWFTNLTKSRQHRLCIGLFDGRRTYQFR
jgi:3-oxoacyl-[acyl-carrier-protein] synthase-3